MKQKIESCISYLQQKFQLNQAPQTCIVLGSGFGDFEKRVDIRSRIESSQIPGAFASSVEGHRGQLLHAQTEGSDLLIVSGRLHGYEGYSPQEVCFLLRCLRDWGVKNFILTNASGSLQKSYPPGELVLIKDHINFSGQSPLTGKELYGGPRFPDVKDLYSTELRDLAKTTASEQKIKILEGVYVGVAGPSFETAAEVQMFGAWGGHLVGMSTVWEALALHQMGARVLGLSCVVNYATGLSTETILHEDVQNRMKDSEPQFSKLILEIIKKI